LVEKDTTILQFPERQAHLKVSREDAEARIYPRNPIANMSHASTAVFIIRKEGSSQSKKISSRFQDFRGSARIEGKTLVPPEEGEVGRQVAASPERPLLHIVHEARPPRALTSQ